jgi:predicted kinase
VIVDATFGEEELQRAFVEDLGEHGPLLAIECVAPADVRIERAAARVRAGGAFSDAGPDVARELGQRFTPMAGLPGDARLAVDTQAPIDLQVDEVEAWLDARLAAGSGL